MASVISMSLVGQRMFQNTPATMIQAAPLVTVFARFMTLPAPGPAFSTRIVHMIHWVDVICPWCWEAQTTAVEADLEGGFVVDCEVCCRPWRVTVSWSSESSEPHVQVTRS